MFARRARKKHETVPLYASVFLVGLAAEKLNKIINKIKTE